MSLVRQKQQVSAAFAAMASQQVSGGFGRPSGTLFTSWLHSQRFTLGYFRISLREKVRLKVLPGFSRLN